MPGASAIAKHPVTGLIVSFIASAFFYWLASADMSPRYAVDSPKTVASREGSVPGLRVVFRDHDVDIVRRSRIVFWNAGQRAIERNSISADSPICVRIPQQVTLLDFHVASTSRPNLKFDLFHSTSDAGCLTIAIRGDEALERGDGGMVEVLFDGPADAAFHIDARVKGVKTGFARESWERAVLRQTKPSDWFGIVNMFGLGLVGIAMFAKEIQRHRAGLSNNLVYASYVFFPTMFLNLWVLKPFLFGLKWVR